MKTEHQSKPGHMMLQMNLWSTIFLAGGVLVTGEIWQFVDFANRFPIVLWNILLFSLLSALGQVLKGHITIEHAYESFFSSSFSSF